MPDHPVPLDQDLATADWIKQSWDIRRSSDFKLVTTAADFLHHLGVDLEQSPVTEQRRRVKSFMHLPMAANMPAKLHDELVELRLLAD